jgi:hypothetical protein
MVESLGFVVLALLLFASLVWLLYRERADKRRLALEKDLPAELRLPHHYRELGEVEKKLWVATEEFAETASWESTRLSLRPPELQVVRGYLAGLREDFGRGNRIFGAVIIHSPDMALLAQLEWQRVKIELSFQFWYRVISVRLSAKAISITELRRLTDVVATLAYQVRTMLRLLEQSGNADFVQSLLKRV